MPRLFIEVIRFWRWPVSAFGYRIVWLFEFYKLLSNILLSS